MDPLVAKAQRFGDLAQRAPRELQPAHGVVEVRPGHVGGPFGVDEARLGSTRVVQQFLVDRHNV
jgi:hypothetical protein